MNDFKLVNAVTVEEAVSILKNEKAKAIAGGTDLLGTFKREIFSTYPETLVNIQNIPGMDYIKEEEGFLKIGSTTKLVTIAENSIIKEKYTALAEAARCTATPQIRNMGTIGGNICQEIRCWYYRGVGNYFNCLKKGGTTCYAMGGQNQNHSIFGGIKICNVPCEAECPNSTKTPEIMDKIRSNDLEGAAKILFECNPLGAITGRVCPHTCESKCNRRELDESVSIRSVERFVGDFILDNPDKFFVKPSNDQGKKAAIIGAGPAGLTVAYHLAKEGYRVTVLDENKRIGGMLTYGIPSYRLDKATIQKIYTIFGNMGIDFKLEFKVGRDKELSQIAKEYDTVFVGIGAWGSANTGCKGETSAGVTSAISFLEKVANKDEVKIGKKIIVIGGGSVAMDAALTAKRLGANDITIISLEKENELPAQLDEVIQAKEEGIKFLHSFGVDSIESKGEWVSGINLVSCISLVDVAGRFSPSYDQSAKQFMEADMVIMAVGQKVNLKGFETITPTVRKTVSTNGNTYETNIKGIFAGGDCATGPATVVKAIAAGRKAAYAMIAFMGGKQVKEEFLKGQKLTFKAACTKESQKLKLKLKPIEDRTFKAEDPIIPTAIEINKESERCMNCGCVAVNCSDIAPALVSFKASIVTTKRTISADKFWRAGSQGSTILDTDELVVEICVPTPTKGTKSAYIKFANRATIDFPITSCAAVLGSDDAKICLNAVHPNPYSAYKAEEMLKGKEISEDLAKQAAEAVVSDAINLVENKYKIQIAKTIIKRTIMACK